MKEDEEKVRWLANVVELSDDAIITKSLDGFITTWNKGAELIYGYSAEEVIGKNISILAPPPLKDEVNQLIKKIKNGEKVFHYETIRDKSNIRYEYLLPLLNSRLIDFIYKYLVPEIGRVFAEVKAVKLMELPIYLANLEEQRPLIEKTEEMLKYNKNLHYELNSFKDWLMQTFNIEKFSQKLDKYYKLSFDDFLVELNKKEVNTKQRKTQELLKKKFEKSITIITPLLHKIEEINDEIDQMVYDLYGLTNEEIKIIEDNI